MRILVTAASKHGATKGIAEAIGTEFVARGWRSQWHRFKTSGRSRATTPSSSVSAVYMGKWMRAAKEFAARESAEIMRCLKRYVAWEVFQVFVAT